MILEVALTELFLIYVVSEAVELVQTIFVYHLSSECQLFILFVVNYEGSTDFGDLTKVLSVFHANQLSYTFDPEFILELKLALFV